MAALKEGDRIAYAAKFLRNTGQFTGSAPQRRGTYLGQNTDRGKPDPDFARVRWDDIEALIASGQGQYGDPEYVAEIRANGSLVHINNIAKVGSPRFASNDL